MCTKKCTGCNIEKPLCEFSKNKKSKDGHENKCKKCKSEYHKKWLQTENGKRSNRKNIEKYNNTEHGKNKRKEQAYKYNHSTKGRKARKKYSQSEKGSAKMKVSWAKRRTIEKELPNNLGDKYISIQKLFVGCAISNKIGNTHLEHWLALSVGHGGTTPENCYPMEGSLNISKNGTNPLKWIETQPTKYKENMYNKLIPYLAEQNKMSISEFVDYTNWCYNHKRTLEEVEEDNKRFGYVVSSQELFYEYIANTHKNI